MASQRTTRGRLAKARAGKVVGGGKPPYGYRYEDDQFHIVEHEAAIVSMIYEWYVYGKDGGPPMVDLAIARELSTMGLQTPGERNGSTLRKRAPGMWSDNAVRRILTSETYAGVWRFGKRPRKHGKRGKHQRKDQVPVNVPAIVSRDLWEVEYLGPILLLHLTQLKGTNDNRRIHCFGDTVGYAPPT